jgi:hypothetical protein
MLNGAYSWSEYVKAVIREAIHNWGESLYDKTKTVNAADGWVLHGCPNAIPMAFLGHDPTIEDKTRQRI